MAATKTVKWDNPVPMFCQAQTHMDAAARDHFGGAAQCGAPASHVEVRDGDAVRFVCERHARPASANTARPSAAQRRWRRTRGRA